MSENSIDERERLMAQRIAEVKARYNQERERRLRADGRQQYNEMAGEFARFNEDTYADPNFSRDPVQWHGEVLIIGGGLGGLITAATLRRAGIDDLLILEKGGDFGGTWYWNRYPGAACDTEAYIYLPMIEELGEFPSEKYARAPEILKHCQTFAKRFDLYDRALLQTALTDLRWDEETLRWRAGTDRGDEISVKFVVSIGGLLQKAKLPGIPGILDFEGPSFHTSRWDYDVTGGSSLGGMTKLADKRIAVIGTGATGVQCIPQIAKDAKHLYVFQRTPSSVFVRDNRPTDPDWVKSLQSGWQARRMDNFAALSAGEPQDEDLVDDGWTQWAFGPNQDADPELRGLQGAERVERAMFLKMERCRQRVDEVVHDPAVAELLKPQYSYFCKRPGFHDEFLQAFNRDNVTLVDTHGRGVDRITKTGLVVDGVEYPVDLIVYATGFELTGDEQRRLGVEIFGRNGLSLNEKFKDGASTFQGLYSHGFPNLLRISVVQTGTAFNYTYILTGMAEHIAWLVKTSQELGIETLEATEAAEEKWVEHILKLARPLRDFLNDCTPSYINREGEQDDKEMRNYAYGQVGDGIRYLAELREWRRKGDFSGLTLSPADAAAENHSERQSGKVSA